MAAASRSVASSNDKNIVREEKGKEGARIVGTMEARVGRISNKKDGVDSRGDREEEHR